MTDSRVAFALRDTHAEGFLGGVVSAGDRDLNLAELLEEGNGLIVVDAAAEPLVVTVLDEFPALKRVGVDEDAELTLGHADRTRGELRTEAKRRGIAGASSASKDELVDALTLDDARIAAGIDQPADYSVPALARGIDPATGRLYADTADAGDGDGQAGDASDNDSPEA